MGGPGNRVSDLYHQALERAPERRSAFLQAACSGDDELRAEVESRLRYEPQAAGFLARPRGTDDDAPAPDRDSMIDRQLGPYTILAPLGAGGMGEVYRARDTKLGREVAIKILPPHLTAEPERRARFAREARLLATLNHPHIGAIYGLEESDGVTALVLELVAGETLAERLTRGPLHVATAVVIARQIADALDAAHERGIVHRDLKPANIVLQHDSGSGPDDARVKVLDFGLAKSVAIGAGDEETVSPETSLSGTEDGRILGTPAYMSPEQARGQPVDRRTDIWAYGCVLFEMLTGRRAYAADTLSDTIARILDGEPDWVALPAGTPLSVRKLLRRCLTKDLRKRLRDIADARLELDDIELGHRDGADPASEPAARRHRERMAWSTAAVLGMATALLAVLYVRAMPPPAEPLEFMIEEPENWYAASDLQLGSASFEVSPDGRLVAMVARAGGVSMLLVRPIGRPAWNPLPGTEGATSPFWAPDSQSIGFFDQQRRLKTVGVDGGAPRIVGETSNRPVPTGAWSEDGIMLIGGDDSISRVAASGGVPMPVTALGTGETGHRWPSFLPDGVHFLFVAQSGLSNELRVGSLASNGTASLGHVESHARYANGHLVYVSGGHLVARRFDVKSRLFTGDPVVIAGETAVVIPWARGQFSVSGSGVLAYSRTGRAPAQLTWRDRSGRPVGTAGEPGIYVNINLSPDEQRIAASRQLIEWADAPPNVDIWLIDLGRAGAFERLTTDPAREFDPVWVLGGTEIVFNSNRIDGVTYSLFRRSADRSGDDRLLLSGDATMTAPDWSPVHRLLMYTAAGNLWTIPVRDDPEPELFLGTTFTEHDGTFSPDGRWVAYVSNETGRQEVYVRPFPERDPPHPVSLNGGRAPRWRGDGREIFFLSPDGTIMAAAIERGRAGLPVPLFETDLAGVGGGAFPYAVTRDGQRFLVPVALTPPGGTPITVVLNWPAMLRDR